MFRKYVLPLLAVVGVGLAVFVVVRGSKTIPPAPPVAEAPQPPYRAFVAGAGLPTNSRWPKV